MTMIATVLAEVAHGHGGYWVELGELVRSPAHWTFDLIVEAVLFLLGLPFAYLAGKRAVRRHDEAHHGVTIAPSSTRFELTKANVQWAVFMLFAVAFGLVALVKFAAVA